MKNSHASKWIGVIGTVGMFALAIMGEVFK